MTEWADTAIVTRRDADLMSATVDGELVGLSVERGTCYGFNGVATRVWEMLEEPARLGDLCERLVEEYDVDSATCRAEVAALLDTLRRSELIDVSA